MKRVFSILFVIINISLTGAVIMAETEDKKELSKEGEAENIKTYFKYIANMWWSNQKTGRWKECNSCGKTINYGDGYCFGFYNAVENSYRVMRLWCDDCMGSFLQDHITGENPFDRDIVLQANNYAGRR
jgi:hypothetical protein